MRVGDVMGQVAIAVGRDTPFADLVETMRRFKVGALAVVDRQRRPVGVVRADDLLLRDTGLAGPREPGRDEHGEQATASGLMTSPAVTVTAGSGVREAARIMHDRGIRQIPVVDDVTGRLVGIVDQADLLKVFIRSPAGLDAEIAGVVRGAGVLPGTLSAAACHGTVTLDGHVPRRSQAVRVTEGVRALDGVTEVRSHLTYEHDDLSPAPPRIAI
ncbi:CBS domain-containing protein [Sphaerisporangium rubeum]|uniref:CBS domain-containing protein n=1 Tax=Sphaerisporangium rubeum TaxID=321317 RepID=A0A7X0M7U0_9ACTN|nr:CBS domain-containing protein [Sphaerisporangium rubeum]MBB6473389.1 CBS domain-containing protein [Sphaerisporangium rubeum]